MTGAYTSPSGTRAVPVLIPALNCAGSIAGVVTGARRWSETVLVVNDGSVDATAECAVQAGATVVSHEHNRGKGAALRTGMQWLAQHGFHHVLTMDADGQHLSEEIPLLLEACAAAPDALIIGARQIPPQATTPAKLFGNRFANRWVEIACGLRLPDTQSGFRVYPLRPVLALRVRANHFAFETEVLIRAARAGIPIRSVPVQVYYPPVDERVSHFEPFRDTVRIIFTVLGLIFRLW